MSNFSGPRDWGRLLTAALTPFGSNDSINEPEFQRILAYLVDVQRNDGVVIAGTTGESPTLTESEKLRCLELALDAVGDRAAVIFGAGTYNTRESIHLTREAEKRGAHGIMLVNPYYNRPGQAGLYAHFSAIAAETDLPVMLYNIAGRSAINLETETLLRLAEIPNIVAVKEASGSMPQIMEVCARVGPDFRVYSGDDALTLPVLSVGGHGVVSVAAHVVGELMAQLINSFPVDPGKARQIHKRLLPLYSAIFSQPSPVPIKYALASRGFECEAVRLPLVALTEAEKSVVRAALDTLHGVAAVS